MEYALSTEEPVGQEIKRIYSNCLRETAAEIHPPFENLPESIHNTRKGIKFIRTLLRLLKNLLGQEKFEQTNLFFRDKSRYISEFRDLHVIIALLQHVTSEAHSVRPKNIKPALKKLRNQEQKLLDQAHQQNQFEKMADELEESCSILDEHLETVRGVSVLFVGLEDIYRNGATHLSLAHGEGKTDQFHEWRKQVKHLLHSYQIMMQYWPETLDINGKSLQQLSDYLGEEHDLALLEELLNNDELKEELTATEAMLKYIDQKRSFLQRSALNLGDFIYSESVEDFSSHFKTGQQ